MKKMTVFDSKKRDHLESKAFLDGGVNIQRYDTVSIANLINSQINN